MGVVLQEILPPVEDAPAGDLAAQLGHIGNEAGDGQQGRGLARAVGPDQGDDLSLLHPEGDAVEGLDVAVTHPQVLDL